MIKKVFRTRFGNVNVELPRCFPASDGDGAGGDYGFYLAPCAWAQRVMDFYSGCGTYSFPMLKQGHQVLAYEGSHEMVAAIHNAIRASRLESHMRVAVRELFAEPVKASDLKYTDSVLITPPAQRCGNANEGTGVKRCA